MPKKRRKPPFPEPEGFVMTPMIDVTFQLIVFFMLVNDMSRQKIEMLKLPKSTEVIRADYLKDENIIICNVMRDGEVRINGQTVWQPCKTNRDCDHSKCQEGLNIERLKKVFLKTYKPGNLEKKGAQKVSKTTVIIRGDADTDFSHIERVLTIACMYGMIYKVKFVAKQEGKER